MIQNALAFASISNRLTCRLFIVLFALFALVVASFASPKVGSVTVAAQIGTLTYGTAGSATYTVTVNRGTIPGSSGGFTATMSVTSTLPSGVTASFSPNPVSFTSPQNSRTTTLTLTSTSGALPAATGFTVEARTSANDFATGGGSLTINQKTIAGSFTVTPKIYDGGTSATIGTRSLVGLVGTDSVTLIGGTAFFVDGNVGTGKVVNGTGFSLSGAESIRYILSSSSLSSTGDITAKPITVTANTQSKVFGTPDPTLTYSSSPSLIGGDLFSGTLTRVAGENVADGPFAITQGTLTAGGNYSIAYVGASLTITKASQTISFGPHGPTKFGQTLTLTATTTSPLPVTFQMVSGPATVSVAGLLTPDANGSATTNVVVEAIQAGNGNYFAATPVQRTIVVKENAPPTSIASQAPAAVWTNQNVNVTLNAVDNAGGDGVATISYTINGGSTITAAPNGSGDLLLPTFATAGTFSIEFYATDVNGNVESTHHVHMVQIDRTAPAGTATGPAPDEIYMGRNWYRSQRTVNFSGTDTGGSGIVEPSSVDLLTVINSQSGYALLSHTFSDHAGNTTPVDFSYWYDDQKPTITPSQTPGGFVASVSGLEIVVADPFLRTDLTQIHLYRTPTIGGVETEVTTWVNGDPIVTDGIYRLTAYGRDEAGNETDPFTMNFTVLYSAPVVEITSPLMGWHRTPQTVSYYGQNAVAGLLTWVLQELLGLPAGTVNPFLSGTLVNPEGRYTVNVSGKDELERIASKTREFQIDGTAPITPLVPNLTGTPGNGGWFKGAQVGVSIVTSDPELRLGVPGSGVKEVRYYTVGANAQGNLSSPIVVPGDTASFNIIENGTTTIHYWAVDEAGNASDEKTAQVMFDNVAPVITGTPADVVVFATSRDGATIPAYTGASATDNLGTATISFDPSGLTFMVGAHVVTMIVADPAGNQTTTTFDVTVNRPVPTLSGISPASATYGDADQTVTLTGTGIFADTKVKIGAVEYSATSSTWTSLTFTLPVGHAGTKHVRVETPERSVGAGDGGESAESQDFVVNPKAITATAANQTKVYGNADPVFTYTLSSPLESGDSFTGALSRATGENVGDYAIGQPGLSLSSDYVLTVVPTTLTITKRPLQVTADAKSKTYGDGDPALTYQVTSGSLAFTDGFTGALSRIAGNDVGSYAIEQGTLDVNGNYEISYVGANLTITKRSINVAANPKTKGYGDSEPTLDYTITSGSLAYSDTFSGSLTRDSGENVGSYAINQGSLALSDNYTLYFAGSNLLITQRIVEVTADHKMKVYGQADPAFTYLITSGSLVSGDVFGGALDRVGGTNVGDYDITIGSLTLGSNYNLQFVGDTLTITPKQLAGSITADNKIYDGNRDSTIHFQPLTGLEGTDAVTLSGPSSGLFDTKNAGIGKTVTVTGLTLSGDDSGNYMLTSTGATAQADISKLDITGSFTAANKVYDGTTSATVSTRSLSGVLGTDAVTLAGGTAAFADANAGNGKTVTLTGGSLAGGDADNYSLTSVGTTTANIAKADATVTVSGYTGVYDGTAHGATGTATGVGGASLSGLDLGATFTNVPGGTAHWTFTGGTNYNDQSGDATITISKKTATITANDKTKVYGAVNPALDATVTGTVGTDTLDYSLSTTATTASGVNSYPISVTLGSNPNYDVTPTSGTLTITKKALSIVGNNATKVYGSTDPTLTATVTGLVAGDNNASIGLTVDRALGENVGHYAITPHASSDNYEITITNGDFEITKKTLTMTVDNKTMLYHGTVPTLTGSLNGVVAGDGITASYSTAGSSSSMVGAYDITMVLNDPNGKLGNYTVPAPLPKGTLTISFNGNSGVLQPVNADGSSVVKKGSTVPIKVKVFDAAGVSVSTPGTIASFFLIGTSANTSAIINEDPISTTPDTAFRWDASGQQWIFNLSTKNLVVGTKYTYKVTFADGNCITFAFTTK